MLENLNSHAFSEHLHTIFQLKAPESAPVPLQLAEVTEKDQSPNVEQFSLIFRGPLMPVVRQGMYTFEHQKLGTLDLFVVPLGPDSTGMSYQVVFNRMRKPSR